MTERRPQPGVVFAWLLVAAPAALPTVRGLAEADQVADLLVAIAAAGGLWSALRPATAGVPSSPWPRLALPPVALAAALVCAGSAGAVAGLLLGLAAFLLAEPAQLDPACQGPPARWVAAVAVALVLAASVTRAVSPATGVAVAASAGAVALAPGLVLGSLLLTPGASWFVRLAWAPLLSLAPELLVLLWLDMLGVRVSAASVALLPAGLTLAAILVSRWPRWTARAGAQPKATATRP